MVVVDLGGGLVGVGTEDAPGVLDESSLLRDGRGEEKGVERGSRTLREVRTVSTFRKATRSTPSVYRELATRTAQRSLTEVSAGGSLRGLTSDVLRSWAENFPEPVTLKY